MHTCSLHASGWPTKIARPFTLCTCTNLSLGLHHIPSATSARVCACSGQQLQLLRRTSAEHGYRYAHDKYCAHLIGEFSHDATFGDTTENYACPDNHVPMNALHANGQPRHWILEVHLLQDPAVGR